MSRQNQYLRAAMAVIMFTLIALITYYGMVTE